jgi:hypothetical protein
MTMIIQNHWGIITGTFTTTVDVYLNLKSFVDDIEFVSISDHKKPSDLIKLFFKNSCFGAPSLMKSFVKKKVFDEDTVICTARFLADCSNDNTIKLRAKRLIILDTLDLAKQKYCVGPNLDDVINADECIFLVNPANKGITRFKEYTYYHKFNQKRLDSKLFRVQKLNYRRDTKPFIKISDGKYFENIGKSVFEYSYRGYPVTYRTDGMFTRDGMYYYLQQVGIDGERNYNPLVISKSTIKKRLFMNKNDILLDLI